MAFSQNNSAATGGLKPEGKYETIITSIDEKTTKRGSQYLSIRLTIRNDVEGQKYGNACLFDAIYKKKEPTQEDLAVNGYTFGRLMAVGKAAKLTDGKEYKDLAEYGTAREAATSASQTTATSGLCCCLWQYEAGCSTLTAVILWGST